MFIKKISLERLKSATAISEWQNCFLDGVFEAQQIPNLRARKTSRSSENVIVIDDIILNTAKGKKLY